MDKIKINLILNVTPLQVKIVTNQQVQTDWNEANINDKRYIKNKPTKVSEFTNDSNFISEEIEPLYSQDKPFIALKSEVPDVSHKLDDTHNTSETSHQDIREDISTVNAIARGKSRARVFDTVADLDNWLSIASNLTDLLVGDNFYIVEVDVPDYWWDGSQKQKLETEKVDLSEYQKSQEADNKYIQSVVHDGSLSGSGTSASPLSVARVELASYDEYLARKTAGTLVAGTIYYWGV